MQRFKNFIYGLFFGMGNSQERPPLKTVEPVGLNTLNTIELNMLNKLRDDLSKYKEKINKNEARQCFPFHQYSEFYYNKEPKYKEKRSLDFLDVTKMMLSNDESDESDEEFDSSEEDDEQYEEIINTQSYYAIKRDRLKNMHEASFLQSFTNFQKLFLTLASEDHDLFIPACTFFTYRSAFHMNPKTQKLILKRFFDETTTDYDWIFRKEHKNSMKGFLEWAQDKSVVGIFVKDNQVFTFPFSHHYLKTFANLQKPENLIYSHYANNSDWNPDLVSQWAPDFFNIPMRFEYPQFFQEVRLTQKQLFEGFQNFNEFFKQANENDKIKFLKTSKICFQNFSEKARKKLNDKIKSKDQEKINEQAFVYTRLLKEQAFASFLGIPETDFKNPWNSVETTLLLAPSVLQELYQQGVLFAIGTHEDKRLIAPISGKNLFDFDSKMFGLRKIKVQKYEPLTSQELKEFVKTEVFNIFNGLVVD